MKNIKVLHISTFQNGGAGIAAMRLHKSLIAQGVESKFLFLEKGIETEFIQQFKKKNYLFELLLRVMKKLGLPPNLEQRNDYKIRKYKRQFEMFSFAITPYTRLPEHPFIQECDIVNLHWVANFIDYQTFFQKINKPIVWTLHDMNPFQGGFHYELDAFNYAKYLNELDNEQHHIKKKALAKQLNHAITVVTPSNWLKEQSQNSEILGRFKHKHIPNGINTNIFKVKEITENPLGLLYYDKITILFVAESIQNFRKGFNMILELLNDVTISSKCQFVAVGDVKKSHQAPSIKYIGKVRDEVKMSQIYNAADIFLLPSREDNLPNTMIESLCCGTPVVGFKIGGLTETINNGFNGYLSDQVNLEGLKLALNRCIANIEKFNKIEISLDAQAKFSSKIQSGSYLQLYKNVTSVIVTSEKIM